MRGPSVVVTRAGVVVTPMGGVLDMEVVDKVVVTTTGPVVLSFVVVEGTTEGVG